jgi:hypothetical protein
MTVRRNDSTTSTTASLDDDSRAVFTSNASGNNDIWLYEFTIASTGYEFSGLTAPVDAWPVTNSMKAGAAVPVKFNLGGDRGLENFESGSPSSQPLSCDANAPTDPVEQTVSAGGSSLAYDAATDTDTYVWKTARLGRYLPAARSRLCRRHVGRGEVQLQVTTGAKDNNGRLHHEYAWIECNDPRDGPTGSTTRPAIAAASGSAATSGSWPAVPAAR